jgi:clan AA aspartic protease
VTTGHVSSLQAIVPVQFRLVNKPDANIQFIVDTGFSGFLLLPTQAVKALGLAYRYESTVRLADGSEAKLPVYEAVIAWNGIDRQVRVLAAGKRHLLGTSLPDGHELVTQFRENGLVTISPLDAANA